MADSILDGKNKAINELSKMVSDNKEEASEESHELAQEKNS